MFALKSACGFTTGRSMALPILLLSAALIISPHQSVYADGISIGAGGVAVGGESGIVIDSTGVHIGGDTGQTYTSSGGVAQSGSTGRQFTATDLRNHDFRGQDLSGATFELSDLRGANFAGADLSGAVIRGSSFRNVNLSGANLAGAQIQASDFRNADITGADLTEAEFEKIDLRNANFADACLLGVVFAATDLRGASARGAYMVGADIALSDVTGFDTSGAVFNGPHACFGEQSSEQIKRPDLTQAAAIRKALSDENAGQIDLTVNFAVDSDEIRGQAHAQIYEIAQALQSSALEGTEILIEGHTDDTGGVDYNIDLSFRRAIAVTRMLSEEYGIDGDRLRVKGLGEAQPIASNDTDDGRALNRRVVLVNLSLAR